MTEFPAAPSPHDPAAGMPTSTGLDPNVASVLAYLLGAVSGLVIFVIERRNPEVRFHAAQSIVFSAVVFALWFALAELPWIPLLSLMVYAVNVLMWMTAVAVWICLMVAALLFKHVRLPVIGTIAERMAAA
ncbi:MAG: DUF4870 domain-containing protein [Haloechinothrix sp.]